MNQGEMRGRGAHTVALEEDGNQGSGDSAKPSGG